MKSSDDSAAGVIDNLIRELGDTHKTAQRRAIDELVAIAAGGDRFVTEKLRESVASAASLT